MQLRYYLTILRRYWIMIVALPVAVALLSLALELRQPVSYVATARIMLSQTPLIASPDVEFPDYNLYHSWVGSEFILDDVPQVVGSALFAQDVSSYLATRDVDIPPAAIQGRLTAEVLHRSVTILATTDNPQTAEAIVVGAIAVLEDNGLQYWNRDIGEGNGLNIAVIDPAFATETGSSTRQLVINVGIRTVLALAAAIGLAFLLHYLDDRVRDRSQAEDLLGAQVIGMIPKE
jgi:capsular polysaccharide biosynthesis protein